MIYIFINACPVKMISWQRQYNICFREEEGIELQVMSSKRSSETPPVGCSSRNSYIEPQQGVGTDADSINSSEYPNRGSVEDITFQNGSSTIGNFY